jgi:predicted phage-related endonuclease
MITVNDAESKRRSEILLGLSDEDVADRRNYIGGSDANTIMSGNPERILQLWEEKTGKRQPENLDDVLPVQMGLWTEALNLAWYERQTGNIVNGRRLQFVHADHPWIKCRPDGLTTLNEEGSVAAVIDAKHVGAFNFDMDKICERYTPQIYVQMMCVGCERGVLSVFSGTMTYEQRVIERDPFYEAVLLRELQKFWECVKNNEAPVEIADAKPPVPVALMREVDMVGNNEWTHHEQTYVDLEDQAKSFEVAKKALKGMVEDDVRLVKGRALQIKRGKSGSLSFSKVKS